MLDQNNINKTGLKRVAVFCILTCGDKYLLLARKNEPHAGKYVPVGGKIDPHEEPRKAVIREVSEEASIILSEVKFCGTIVETSPIEYNWVSYIYKAEIPMYDLPYCSEGTLHWIDKANLNEYPLPPTDLIIFELASQHKIFAVSATYDDELSLISLVDELDGLNYMTDTN
jgi:8-oxo-dGTP diphosphatase